MPMNSSKRPLEDSSSIERPRMMPLNKGVTMGDDTHTEKKFQFRVLLPNSTTIELKMSNDKRNKIPIQDFKILVRKEYDRGLKQRIRSPKSNRIINWEHQDLHFVDAQLKEIRSKVNLCDFMPNKWNFLWLHDGSAETEVYEGVWDLNEDPHVMKDHIDDYTALHTLKTPKLEVEDDIPTGSASLYQKELEDNLVSTAIEMNDCSRELERIRCIKLHIQHKIEELQVKPRLFFEKAWAPQLLAEKKLELAEISEWLDEENEAYKRAIEKFLAARDKYNNLSRVGSDVPIDEGRSQ